MRRTTLFTTLALFGLLTLLAIAPALSPETAVQAEHNKNEEGDPTIDHSEWSNLIHGALNRNLIFGEAIRVCTMYPNATEDAVIRWHNKLRDADFIALGTRVFDIQVLPNNDSQTVIDGCPEDSTTTPPAYHPVFGGVLEDEVKISGLLILEGDPEMNEVDEDGNPVPPEVFDYCFDIEAFGCLHTGEDERLFQLQPHFAFHGRHIILLNREKRQVDNDDDRFSRVDSERKAYARLVETLTHELGHILGFGHWKDEQDREQNVVSVMTSGAFGEVGDEETNRTSEIADLDLSAYANAYRATALRAPIIETDDSYRTLSANFVASYVHNAMRFDIMLGRPVGGGLDWTEGGVSIGVSKLDSTQRYMGPVAGLDTLGGETVGIRSWSFAYIKDPQVVSSGLQLPVDLEVKVSPEWCADVVTTVPDGWFISGDLFSTSVLLYGAPVTFAWSNRHGTCQFDGWTVSGSEGESGGRSADGSQVRITLTDESIDVVVDRDRTVTAEFTWTDEAPEFAVETDSQSFQVGVPKSAQLPRATGGNGDLTYSLSRIPAGLEFDSATAVLARRATTEGTMTAGTTTATLTVHDADDNLAASDAARVTVTVTINVTAPSCTRTLTVTASGGGSVSGGGTYACDTTATAMASWNAATHTFSGWIGACSGSSPTCSVLMNGDKSAHATFAPVVTTYTLTLSVGSGGRLSANPDKARYNSGETVTVTATANSGKRIASWGGHCAGTDTTDTTCSLVMNGNRTASATFEDIPRYTLTTSAGSGGGIDPAPGTHTYNSGASVTVTATANSGKRIASWGGDCAGTATTDPTCSLVMNGNRTASATFEDIPTVVPTYTLTTSAGSGGRIDPAPGTHTYNSGAPVTVTATANSGKRIASWGGDCAGTATTDPTCSLVMNGNRTASATFEDIPTVVPTYTLTTSAGSGGRIDPAPGTHTYNSGAPVTVTATANSGKRIASWGGDCAGTATTDPTCSLVMNGNRTASATFEDIPRYTLTTSAGSGGRIDPAPGMHTYESGASVTVTATADSGNRIASWGGDCVGTDTTDTTCSLVMNGNRTASVTFEVERSCEGEYTLTTSAGSGGSIDPAPGTHSYDCDTTVTVRATANSGYRIGSWGGNCRSVSDSTCTLTMNGNRTASVSFVRQYTLTTSAGSGGRIDPAPGTHTYDSGESVTVTATANSGKRIASWGGDCASTATTDMTCSLVMNGNRTASATFEDIPPLPPNYSLTLSAGSGGRLSASPNKPLYNPGESVTVTAAPNTGYQVDAWGGNCAGTSARSLTCGLTMNANKTASVTFRKCELRVLSAGNGTVAGGGTVDCGSRPRITATPDSNYCYDRWDGEFGVRSETTPRSPECHAGGNFSVTVHRDVTYTAHFVEKPKFTLTTTAGANGNISPSGSNQYYFDKTVTITADPDEGYEVDAWSGDCAGVTGTACTVAMNTDRTAGVTFEDIPHIYSWSGWCYDLGGTADSGSGLSEAAAHAAGQAFKDSCRPGGFTSTVTEDTDWYAYVTCDGGATFNLGPFDSMSAAETGAGLIISAACGSGLTRLSLPVGDSLTVAQVREALRSALAALPTPVDLDDLTLPVTPKGQDGPTHGGSFSTYVGDDGRQYAAVTCDDERSFTLGPANTLVEILDAGFLGLRVCANGDALTELSLPESGTVTRAQLEGAITTALAASSIELTLRDLAAPPAAGVTARAPVQVRGGSYTLSSTTTWVWKVTCTAGGSEGGIATSEESVVLAVAGAAAGCPRGGGDYSVSPD